MYGSGEQARDCVMWASFDGVNLAFGNTHAHLQL